MTHTIKGILHAIKETQKVTESFKKREFVIKIEDAEYPQYISLQFKQERCEVLDIYEEGERVEVIFSINGRRYEKDGEVKYFNSLDAWRLIREGGEKEKYASQDQEEKEDSPF